MSETMLGKAGRSPYQMLQSVLSWLISSTGGTFVVIFILAIGMRVFPVMRHSSTYLLPTSERELGAICRSIEETGQFANPYLAETGPTAHLPPIPPAICALARTLFGYSTMAGYAFTGFIILTTSVLYALLPWAAGKFGVGKAAGLVAGLTGAILIEGERLDHGEGLAGLLMVFMLMAFLTRWNQRRSTLLVSLMLGLVIGTSFHVQPVLLLVFLGCLVYELGWQRLDGKLATTGMLALGVLLACVPWAWRNYIVFDEFFFIRSNLGLELRMGYHDGAAPSMERMNMNKAAHPRLHLEEVLKVQEQGEMEYMRQAMAEVLSWVRAHPGEFIRLTILRVILLWFGPLDTTTRPYIALLTILAILGARRILPALAAPQRVVILVPLITFPLIYYLVPYMPRYRIPIDWMILLLASAEILHLVKPKRQESCAMEKNEISGQGVSTNRVL